MPSDAIDVFLADLNKSAAEVADSLAVGTKPNLVFAGSENATCDDVTAMMQTCFSFKCVFGGMSDGRAIIIIPDGLALSLAATLMGSDKPDSIQAAENSALFELCKSIVLRWANDLGKLLNQDIIPEDLELLEPGSDGPEGDEPWFRIDFGVTISSVESMLNTFIPEKVADVIDTKLGGKKPLETETQEEKTETIEEKTEETDDSVAEEEEPIEAQVKIKQAQFQQIQADVVDTAQDRPIELILDVPLLISVELGRKELSIKEILELSPGSLIELNQLAGEPVDLLINGKLFARGEVVVIDENFGIRVTNIISPQERVEKLR